MTFMAAYANGTRTALMGVSGHAPGNFPQEKAMKSLRIATLAALVLALAPSVHAEDVALSPGHAALASSASFGERSDATPEYARLERRYKRLRIIGGVLMGASATAVAATAIATSVQSCEGWFCGPAIPTIGVSTVVALPMIAGGISLGIGAKRGRRLKLQAPQLAVSRHGMSLSLGGSF